VFSQITDTLSNWPYMYVSVMWREENCQPCDNMSHSSPRPLQSVSPRHPGDAWIPVVSSIALQYCFLQVLHILQYVQYWLLASIAHTMQYCNTDTCSRDALCRHYVMSLFDRYMLQPATTCTEEALWAQYMNVLLMGMSFSGLSTLFTSVRAIPKSGPVQVSAILWILVCAILPFLQVLHIPWYVQYCLFPSIAHTMVCAITAFS
jgi:hypothetical protein